MVKQKKTWLDDKTGRPLFWTIISVLLCLSGMLFLNLHHVNDAFWPKIVCGLEGQEGVPCRSMGGCSRPLWDSVDGKYIDYYNHYLPAHWTLNMEDRGIIIDFLYRAQWACSRMSLNFKKYGMFPFTTSGLPLDKLIVVWPTEEVLKTATSFGSGFVYPHCRIRSINPWMVDNLIDEYNAARRKEVAEDTSSWSHGVGREDYRLTPIVIIIVMAMLVFSITGAFITKDALYTALILLYRIIKYIAIFIYQIARCLYSYITVDDMLEALCVLINLTLVLCQMITIGFSLYFINSYWVTTLVFLIYFFPFYGVAFSYNLLWYFESIQLEWIVDRLTTKICTDHRDMLRNIDLSSIPNRDNHSHPSSAALRGAADFQISSAITNSGREIYAYEMSKRDEIMGNHGYRDYTFPKDLSMRYRNDTLTSNHVIKLIDSDYGLDMNKMLTLERDIIMYTFTPRRTGGSTSFGEGMYSISNNYIDLDMNGSAFYHHQLWDYAMDHIYIKKTYPYRPWRNYGLLYLVETKETIDPDRSVVLFTLVRKLRWPLCNYMPASSLKRRQFSLGSDHNHSVFHGTYADTPMTIHSISKQGTAQSFDIPQNAITTIHGKLSRLKEPLISTAETACRSYNIKGPDAAATLLTHIIEQNPDYLVSHNKRPRMKHIPAATSYQVAGNLLTEDGKDCMRSVMTAIILGAVAPKRSNNNDVTAVNDRLNSVKNIVKRYPNYLMTYKKEFATLVIPDFLYKVGVPTSYEQVNQSMKRPNQRSLFNRFKHVIGGPFRFTVSSFQKSEWYNKIRGPRMISPVPIDHKIRYSTFTHSLADTIKQTCPWYAFGKSPRDIADMIHDRAQYVNEIHLSDKSSFDGSQGRVHVELWQAILSRYFDEQYLKEALELENLQHFAKGFTSTGVKYNTGTSMLSGSPETSLKNTCINAFQSYAALRKGGMSISDAWRSLGFYGGDDGLNFGVDPRILEQMDKVTGLTSRTEVITRGSQVNFLGRVYINPWESSDNIADVPRRLLGFHLTDTPRSVPDRLVLLRKAEGILTTDPNTPLLSNLAHMIKRSFKDSPIDDSDKKLYNYYLQDDRYDCNWWEKYGTESFPPLKHTGLARNIISNMLGVEPAAIEHISELLDKSTLQDLHVSLPLNLTRSPSIKTSAMLGDDYVRPPQEEIDKVIKDLVEQRATPEPDYDRLAQIEAVLAVLLPNDQVRSNEIAHYVAHQIRENRYNNDEPSFSDSDEQPQQNTPPPHVAEPPRERGFEGSVLLSGPSQPAQATNVVASRRPTRPAPPPPKTPSPKIPQKPNGPGIKAKQIKTDTGISSEGPKINKNIQKSRTPPHSKETIILNVESPGAKINKNLQNKNLNKNLQNNNKNKNKNIYPQLSPEEHDAERVQREQEALDYYKALHEQKLRQRRRVPINPKRLKWVPKSTTHPERRPPDGGQQ